MNEWNAVRVFELLKEASIIADTHFRRGVEPGLKGDMSLVTVADCEVETLLATEFDRPEDGVWLIGEETVAAKDEKYIADALANRAWIVDPIDGTAPFANGHPTWGVSIAFAENGRIVEGAISIPRLGHLMVSDGDRILAAEFAGEPTDWRFEDLKPFTPVSPSGFTKSGMLAVSQDVCRIGGVRTRNPVHAVCSCVYTMHGILTGRYLGFASPLKIWDMAGGLALFEKCGFAGVNRRGEPFTTLIDETHYHLSGEWRWLSKGCLFFAATEEIAAEFAGMVHPFEPRPL